MIPRGNEVRYSMDATNVPKRLNLEISTDSITVQSVHAPSHDLSKDPLVYAFRNDLAFLRNEPGDEHLNIMGYKIKVDPKYGR